MTDKELIETKDKQIAVLERKIRCLQTALDQSIRNNREDIRAAAAEQRWQEIQGDDYGSY